MLGLFVSINSFTKLFKDKEPWEPPSTRIIFLFITKFSLSIISCLLNILSFSENLTGYFTKLQFIGKNFFVSLKHIFIFLLNFARNFVAFPGSTFNS